MLVSCFAGGQASGSQTLDEPDAYDEEGEGEESEKECTADAEVPTPDCQQEIVGKDVPQQQGSFGERPIVLKEPLVDPHARAPTPVDEPTTPEPVHNDAPQQTALPATGKGGGTGLSSLVLQKDMFYIILYRRPQKLDHSLLTQVALGT